MKVIFFLSSKGGCGKSFIIKNISDALSLENKVLIAELNDKYRYLDLMYDVSDSILYDISDYSSGDVSLDDSVANINENADIICSPLDFKPYNVESCIGRLISDAKDNYDILLIDVCDNSYIDIIKKIHDECEFVLVTDSSFVSQRGSKSLLLYLDDERKCSLIVNRVNPSRIEKGYDKGVDEILDILRIPLLGVVYDFSGGFDERMNPVRKDDELLLQKIFDSIAKRIKGDNIPVTDYKNSVIKKLFG